MKGSKKRAASSEEVEHATEKRSAKKPKPSPQKGQKQKQNASNASLPVANLEPAQSDNAAQKQSAETSEIAKAIPAPSSSREPIIVDNAKPASSKAEVASERQGAGVSNGKAKQQSKDYKIRKLSPRRPFPTVPTSVSATGPRSAHTEGKNYICITRRTQLGAYLRRCKELVLKDG